MFEDKDRSPANQEWNASEDAEAAVHQSPGEWDTADGAGDEGKRNDARARNQPEGDEPIVAHRIYKWTNEGDRNDEVSEGEPIGAVRKKGIGSVHRLHSLVNAFDPREQACGHGDGPQAVRLNQGEKALELGLERKRRNAAQDQAGYEYDEPDTNAT